MEIYETLKILINSDPSKLNEALGLIKCSTNLLPIDHKILHTIENMKTDYFAISEFLEVLINCETEQQVLSLLINHLKTEK